MFAAWGAHTRGRSAGGPASLAADERHPVARVRPDSLPAGGGLGAARKGSTAN